MSGLGDLVRHAAITVLGSGHAPVASGTFGSAAAVAIYLAARFAATSVGVSGSVFDAWVVTPGILISVALGIAWGPWAIARWGSKDPKPFVLDEFAGQWTALLLLPSIACGGATSLGFVIAGQFFLFRVFDVLKPEPAGLIDRGWPGGWGITLDDVVAGIYANIAGQLLWRLTPAWAWLGLAAA